MADGGKAPERRVHPIGWESGHEAADWERIERCAAMLSDELHLDLNPVDVVRMATRRFLDEKLGPAVTESAKASA